MMIVLTDSMVGDKDDSFNGGDLIFVKTVKPEDVKVGDVISFFDPNGNGSTVTSHRVVEVINEDGKISFKTKGDNNNTEDKLSEISVMLAQQEHNLENAAKFTAIIESLVDIKELNKTVLNKAIDKILVHEAEKVDGKRTQLIDIYYRFVGNINDNVAL